MKIFAISGKAQHGKDTVAGILKETLVADGYSVLIVHYGDLLKHICRSIFGWDGKKDEHGRHTLQYVGTDVIRGKEPDYWVGFVAGILDMFPGEWDYVLIPDSRFPNEIEYLRARGFDVTHLRVVRPNFKSPLTKKQQQHLSETSLDGVEPDFRIENGGNLAELRAKIVDFLVELNGYHQMTVDELLPPEGRERCKS